MLSRGIYSVLHKKRFFSISRYAVPRRMGNLSGRNNLKLPFRIRTPTTLISCFGYTHKSLPFLLIQIGPAVNEYFLRHAFIPENISVGINRVIHYIFCSIFSNMIFFVPFRFSRTNCIFEHYAVTVIEKHLSCTASRTRVVVLIEFLEKHS